MSRSLRRFALALCLILAAGLSLHAQEQHPQRLELEPGGQALDPVRVPTAPTFRWQYAGPGNAALDPAQAEARILVSSGAGQIWDSGWIRTAAHSLHYAGPQLTVNGGPYSWSVQTRDGSGAAGPVSRTGYFSLVAWIGHWIQAPFSTMRDGAEADGSRPMPVFRRSFNLSGASTQLAILKIAGLGQYVVLLDGKPLMVNPLHNFALLQAWTDYRKTITYDTIPLSLPPGPHVLAVALGNGMYNVQRTVLPGGKARYTKFEGSFGPPKLIADLELNQPDGSQEVIGTDGSWLSAPGSTTFSSTYGGEDADARRLAPGWSSPGFDDSSWTHAVLADSPGGRLVPAVARLVHELPALEGQRPHVAAVNKLVYDFGSNVAAFPRLRVRGPAGAIIKLTPGELLKPDGSVSQSSSGGPQWWSYTLRGDPDGESWQPAFSYYGFRYLQVEWSGTALPPERDGLNAASIPAAHLLDLYAVPITSAGDPAGTFSSSSELLNRIHALIVAAMHNNEVSLFTDCPHREKLGWLEQTHLVADALMFNNDLDGLYRATARNIADAQGSDGMVPTIAPQFVKFGPKYPVYDDSPEWGSAAILAPWAAYRHYGDKAELARAYPVMQRYLSYLISRAQDGIVAYGLGDWYDVGPRPPGFEQNTTLGVTGTLMLYEDAATLARIAQLLGHAEDAETYAVVAFRTATAYDRRFWVADKGWYDTGSQTANAMPLALGIVPAARQQQVFAHLLADLHAHNDHVTTGEVGFPYLLRALMLAGSNDVIYALMTRTDAPSYGAQLAAGATALTEAWDANPRNSQDHFMLGAGEEWFYRGLAGLDFDLSRPDPATRITLRPAFLPQLDRIDATYDSKLGLIESHWKRIPTGIAYDIVVPAGTEATVLLPDREPQQATPGPHHYTLQGAPFTAAPSR